MFRRKNLFTTLAFLALASINSAGNAAFAQEWMDMQEPAADANPYITGVAEQPTKVALKESPWTDAMAPARTGLQAPMSVDSAPIGKQSFNLGFGPGSASPYISGYLSKPTATSLPYTATSAVDINIVGDPIGSAFGGCSKCGGGSGGEGGDGQQSGGCPEVKVPDDCYGCFPVVNTHNGCIMGYKNSNETWRDFWTGKSGHLTEYWLEEGAICLQQMIGAGMDPDSTGIPFGMGF